MDYWQAPLIRRSEVQVDEVSPGSLHAWTQTVVKSLLKSKTRFGLPSVFIAADCNNSGVLLPCSRFLCLEMMHG